MKSPRERIHEIATYLHEEKDRMSTTNCFDCEDYAHSLRVLESKLAWQAEMLERAKDMIDYEERVSGVIGREKKEWLTDLEKGSK